MASFLARALRYLSGAYQIKGSEVTTDILDLSGVQLVQEVSDFLAAGRGPGLHDGWAVARMETVHDAGGASTESVSLDPYDPPGVLGAAWPDRLPEEFDLWLYDIWGALCIPGSSTADFTVATVYLQLPSDFPGPTAVNPDPPFPQLLARATTTDAADPPLPSTCESLRLNAPPASQIRYPILYIPQGATLWQRTRMASVGGDGGISVVTNWLIRAVPRGIRPYPGG